MKLLHDIQSHCTLSPSKAALEDASGRITYGELACFVERMAAHLHAQGVKKGDRVAIQMQNSRHYIVAILSCIRIGALWVPVNYTHSDATLRANARVFAPRLVVSDADQFPRLVGLYGPIPAVLCDSPHQSSAATTRVEDIYAGTASGSELPQLAEDRDSLAYIIHTSGSTGMPKGVAVSLGSLNNYVYETCADLHFHANTRTLSITPYYFDAPLGSIFCTLVRGGTLLIFPRLLHPRFIAEKVISSGITYIGTTPGLFKILVEAVKSRSDREILLEVVGVGGDITSKGDLLEFMELCPRVQIFNRYGPTETTSVASSHRITQADLMRSQPIPIGKPLRGVTFHLVGENDAPIVEPHRSGELCIGGAQVMRGYYEDPQLTAQVLRSDLVEGDVVYRTGDLCSMDDAGNYVFHSRVGGLLKRNGIRVHLTEIERAIKSCADVKDCVCLTPATSELVLAFVVSRTGASDRERLDEELLKQYPKHFLPDSVHYIEAIPYTHIGKIDRSALLDTYHPLQSPLLEDAQG